LSRINLPYSHSQYNTTDKFPAITVQMLKTDVQNMSS